MVRYYIANEDAASYQLFPFSSTNAIPLQEWCAASCLRGLKYYLKVTII